MSDRENVLDWLNRDQRVSFTLNQLRLKNQIRKLIEDGDTEIKIDCENDDGSITGTMPLSYLKICKPKKKNYSEEQRKAIAERFRRAKQSE